jgi:hypothetical protein
MGRPSIPMETYLRLMFLKHRYRLGYESLCTQVSERDLRWPCVEGAVESISWKDADVVARGCG